MYFQTCEKSECQGNALDMCCFYNLYQTYAYLCIFEGSLEV